MIRLTQRQINHGIFGLLTLISILILMTMVLQGVEWAIILLPASTCTLCAGLWIAYTYGWESARHALVIGMTVLLAVGLPDVTLSRGFTHVIYGVPVLALILTGPVWVIGSAAFLLAAFIYRAGVVFYADPYNIIVMFFLVGGMVLSRVAVDNAERLDAARRESESQRVRAEAEQRRAEDQASELATKNAEQQRLLDLVTTLETPTIVLADGVLLAPIVGALDSRRATTLTNRLLHEASSRRAHKVILDIAGVSMVDTQVAHALLQTVRALGMLGCAVAVTGISASVATTITHLGIDLSGVTTARSPQDALAMR